MCSFCFNKIEFENKICPACRTPYDKENYVTTQPTKEELQRYKAILDKRSSKKKKESGTKKEHSLSSSSSDGRLSASCSSGSLSSSGHHNHNNHHQTYASSSHLTRTASGDSVAAQTQTTTTTTETETAVVPDHDFNDENTVDSTAHEELSERKLIQLSDTRVVQRNLVYVTNIPISYIYHVKNNNKHLFT